MPNPRLSRLREDFTNVRSAIDTIEQRAAAEDGRDLTDAEQAEVDVLFTRATQIGAELEPIAARESSVAATAAVLAGLGLGQPQAPIHQRAATPAELPSAGQYLADYFRAANPDNPARAADVEAFVEKYRTVADQLTTDNAGIIPTPIVGQVISFTDGKRPVFDSFTQRPMPMAGKTFTRPRLTQHVAVAEQTTEKTELASQKMTLTSDPVSKRTFGGVLDISQQDIDWTDPSILDIVLQDFIDQYAIVTEGEACDALEAAATNTNPFVSTTTADVLESFTTAAVDLYGTAKAMPDTVWLSLDKWASLASLVDGQDRPLFPQLGTGVITVSEGTFTGNPLGLRVVVGPQLAAGTMILGARSLIEAYEQKKGLLRAPNLQLFGVDVAYAGYIAFFARSEAFIGLV